MNHLKNGQILSINALANNTLKTNPFATAQGKYVLRALLKEMSLFGIGYVKYVWIVYIGMS